jgi:hypothetical protein
MDLIVASFFTITTCVSFPRHWIVTFLFFGETSRFSMSCRSFFQRVQKSPRRIYVVGDHPM